MVKKRKIVSFLILSLVMLIIILSFVFMPTISLTPTASTKEILENYHFKSNTGLFYISDPYLDDLLNDFIKFKNTEQYQKLEKLAKRNRGAIINSDVAFDLILLGADESHIKTMSKGIFTFEQIGDTVFASVEERFVTKGNPLPKGYKVY